MPFPLSIPAGMCSALSTPIGGSREQKTSLKSRHPSNETPPHLAPCLPHTPALGQLSETLLFHQSLSPPSPPREPSPLPVPPILHQPEGWVQPPDSSSIVHLLCGFSASQVRGLPPQVDHPSFEARAMLSPAVSPMPGTVPFRDGVQLCPLMEATLPSAACPLCPL